MAPPSTPDKYPTQNMFDEMVTIEVVEGRKRKAFPVHKGVVSFYSGFFDRAFNGKFEEGREGIVSLHGEDVQVVGAFVRWLYTRQLGDMPATGDKFNDIYLKLWVFANHRDIPLMMNDAIKRIRDELVRTWKFPKDHFKYIYGNSSKGSSIRRFFSFVITRSYSSEQIEGVRDKMPEEMLGDLLVEMTKYRISGPSYGTYGGLMTANQLKTTYLCQFHQHEAGTSCPY